MNKEIDEVKKIDEQIDSLVKIKNDYLKIIRNEIENNLKKLGLTMGTSSESDHWNEYTCCYLTYKNTDEDYDYRDENCINLLKYVNYETGSDLDTYPYIDRCRFGTTWDDFHVLMDLYHSNFYQKILLNDKLSMDLEVKEIKQKGIKI